MTGGVQALRLIVLHRWRRQGGQRADRSGGDPPVRGGPRPLLRQCRDSSPTGLTPLTAQVCELDIIFNFHKAHYIIDELFVGGHLQETSKAEVLRIW